MHRVFLTTLLVGAAVAAAAGTAGSYAAPPAACQTAEVRQHDEAVFGHTATRAQGVRLAGRAAKLGFRGVKIEDEGCGDFEVEIDGADSGPGRVSFAAEALKAGFEISFEQTGPPLQPPAGQQYGTLGKLPTVTAANGLVSKLSAAGFRYVDVVKVASGWAVVMPQVPVSSVRPLAAEVRKAGFSIAFTA
ncbi:MAG: hypothetical protein QOF75_1523 [Gaiellaceae bacterium]|jgi:hypothetical protein|nr:hypothetical protein [Gaiellaceae bacterium]